MRAVTITFIAFTALTTVASSACRSREHAAAVSPEPQVDGRNRAGDDDAAAPVATSQRDALGRDVSAARAVPPEVAPFHVIGRVDSRDPGAPTFGWPGTELRMSFVGAGLSLVLADTGASHYDVAVDGGPATTLTVSGHTTTYEVAGGLAAGEHSLVVTKRTETAVGVTKLLGVTPHPGGALVPTPVPAGRRIEIVGDSITCGFGVLGADAFCSFTADTESEPLAWGALAARQLSAVHQAIAVSGIGVLRNYDGRTEGTMPEVYGRSIANDPSSVSDHSFAPEVVVVSLGTNDFAGGKGDPGVAFLGTYVTFLSFLRARHAGAHIVATTSPMLSGAYRTRLRAYLESAIAERVAAGDAKLTLLEIDEQDFADGLGCGYHPGKTTQAKMAARLVAHVKSLTGW